jgi:phage portal protein BeeE
MGLLERIKAAPRPEKKHSLSFGGTGQGFNQGNFWQHLNLLGGGVSGNQERIENDFESYVQRAYKANGIVFAAMSLRHLVFSEARFQWRPMAGGKPGDLFGSADLGILERPAPNQTTGELLARMLITADLAGNYYGTLADDAGRLGRAATGTGRRIVHLRPDWVTIVVGSHSGDPNAADAKVLGYQYTPLGSAGTPQSDPVLLLPNEVCHFSPEPDPEARFRGMSWLTPVIREIMADKAATEHKAKFFENGATPGVAIKFDKDTDDDAFEAFVEGFKSAHQGSWNAYKTLFLTGGADITPVSMDLKQLEFSTTQGAGESRIAAASGVHPTLLGTSEGLQGSALNAGNYQAVRRAFVDGRMRPLWRMACASLESLVPPPAKDVQLWYDVRDIAFLRDDQKDVAQIRAQEAGTIRQLVDAGYEADSVVAAVVAEDWTLLKHSGLFSIQLQPPMTAEQQAAEAASPPKESNDSQAA